VVDILLGHITIWPTAGAQVQQTVISPCYPTAQWSEHPHGMQETCVSLLISLVDPLHQSLWFTCGSHGFDSLCCSYSMWHDTTDYL